MASVALNNVNQMLNAENREALMATVRSLRDLSAGLNERLGALDRTLAQVGAAASETSAWRPTSWAAPASVSRRWPSERASASTARSPRPTARWRRRGARSTRSPPQAVRCSSRLRRPQSRLETAAAGLDDQLGAAVTELRLSIESATSRRRPAARSARRAARSGQAQLGPGEQRP